LNKEFEMAIDWTQTIADLNADVQQATTEAANAQDAIDASNTLIASEEAKILVNQGVIGTDQNVIGVLTKCMQQIQQITGITIATAVPSATPADPPAAAPDPNAAPPAVADPVV
jgi:hypothetical protein